MSSWLKLRHGTRHPIVTVLLCFGIRSTWSIKKNASIRPVRILLILIQNFVTFCFGCLYDHFKHEFIHFCVWSYGCLSFFSVKNFIKWVVIFSLAPCFSNVGRRYVASPSVIVIGGGMAGLAAARTLHDESFQVCPGNMY